MALDPNAPPGLYDFAAWLETNKEKVIVVVAVLTVLGLAAFVYRWKNQQTEFEANTRLLSLQTSRPQDVSPTASDFREVAQEYPRSGAAERAQLLAAGALFNEGKFAEAHEQFQKVLQEQRNRPWAAEAALGVAASLEADGKLGEALAAYERVVEDFAAHAVVPQARIAIARIHAEQGEPQRALAIYDSLTQGEKAGAWASEVQSLRQKLLADHPGLAETNAPAASGTTLPPQVLPEQTLPVPAEGATEAPAEGATEVPAVEGGVPNVPEGEEEP